MLTIGNHLPAFKMTAVVSSEPSKAFKEVTNQTYKGKWLILFAWPKDFTFVCPTEISGFCDLNKEFENRGAQLLGMSTDTEYVHLAWRQTHPDLKNLSFPMLADVKRDFSHSLGIINEKAGVCNRATFVVDPEGVIRHVSVNDLSVGRNPAEVLRILDALQTEELCGCNWKKGDKPLKAA